MSTFRRRMMMKAREQQSSVEDLDYFTVVPEIEEGITIHVSQGYIEQELDFESNYYACPYDYRIDEGEWIRVDDAFATDSPPSRNIYIPFGSRLQLKSDFVSFLEINEYDYIVSMIADVPSINKYYSIEGTIMSLIYGEPRRDFDLSRPLPGMPNIGDTNLLRVNSTFLPSRILYPSCYTDMFYGCTSLVNAPELPATTLASHCYDSMFFGCTNLNYIKMLATDISATNCLDSWVYGVASTGTFVKSKDATWDVTGVNGVPTGWKVITDDQESEGSQWTYEKHYVFVLVEDIDGFYAVLEDTIDVYNLTLTMLNSIGLEAGEDSWYSLYIDAVPDEFNITFNGEKINSIVLSRDGYIEFETNSYYIDMDINVAMVYGR